MSSLTLEKVTKPTVISLFAGAGGKDLGFLRAGFDVVWANDVDAAACATYRDNVGSHIHHEDIRSVDFSTLPSADLVIGGFPCQGFSIVGTRRLDDERNFLYRAMKEVVRQKLPSFFVAENVRGLLSLAGGRVFAAMVDEFAALGYQVTYWLLNARSYGVPQHRERVFIVGSRTGRLPIRPPPTHISPGDLQALPGLGDTNGQRPYRTLRDAIEDLVILGSLPNHEVDESWRRRHPEWETIIHSLKPGQKLCNVRLGPRSVCTWDIPGVFGAISEAERDVLVAIARHRRRKKYGARDGNPLPLSVISQVAGVPNAASIVASLVEKDYLVPEGDRYALKHAFNGIFRRLRWDHPSEAVLTVFHSPRYYVHPSAARPLSVREVARIQGFPDDFVFQGSLKDQYTQVGNAVPPPLAEAVARQVLRALDEPAAGGVGEATSVTSRNGRLRPVRRVEKTTAPKGASGSQGSLF
jgi:DNA (cytosine-5)-methyltransferase 1